MTANTSPINTRTPDIQLAESIIAAHDVVDLTAGTSYLVFTADATEGGFIKELRIKANPAANTAASVIRVWINNGATLATPANSALFIEQSLPATVASASVANPDFIIPMGMVLPAGHRIFVTIATLLADQVSSPVSALAEDSNNKDPDNENLRPEPQINLRPVLDNAPEGRRR